MIIGLEKQFLVFLRVAVLDRFYCIVHSFIPLTELGSVSALKELGSVSVLKELGSICALAEPSLRTKGTNSTSFLMHRKKVN